jgi:hypothetical protein
MAYRLPINVADVTGLADALESAPTAVGGKVDFGYCQSEISVDTWYPEAEIRDILQGIKDSGATRVRMAGWGNNIEPVNNSPYDWDGLDQAMDLCEEYGLEPLLVITSPLAAGATTADYAQLCGAVAARYGAQGTGQLKHYQVWNEPNNSVPAAPFTFGFVAYTAILIAAAAAIRAADSEAFIVSCALMSTVDFSTTDVAPSTYLQGIYDNGGGDAFDAVGFNFYCHTPDFATQQEPTRTQTFYLELLELRSIMVAEGQSAKKIWITEMGYPSLSTTATADPVVRAQWTAQQIELIALLDYVETFFLYNYRDSAADDTQLVNTFGSVEYDFGEKQPLLDVIKSINSTVKLDVEGSGVTLDETRAATLVPLSTFFEGANAVYPAPGGHLTTDAGIQDGIPSPTTGLRFVAWNATDSFGRRVFNYQGCNAVTGPSAVNATAAAAIGGATTMSNACTPRNHGFGTLSADSINGTQNIRFDTDSLRVIPVWVNFNGYHGSSYHDMHMQVEGADGKLQHLSNGAANNGLPRTATTGGGVKRRELTWADRRMKTHRTILSGYGYFMGVYIDTNATIRRTPNKPLLMGGIDSWWEPNGCAWSGSTAGGAWGASTGSYQCLGMPEAISFHTGLPVGTTGNGGCGWKAANGVTAGESPTYNTVGTASCQASDVRMADLATKFSAQHAIHLLPGSWNDGTTLGTPYDTTYATRAALGFTKLIAYADALGHDIKFITGQIQPVDRVNADARDLSDTGLATIPALYPDNCLGIYNMRSMWPDTTYPSGARSIYCHAEPFSSYIHLWLLGFMSVGRYISDQIGRMAVPLDYVQKAQAW